MTQVGWGQRETPYKKWQKGEGIPIYEGSHVSDLSAADVAPWSRVGQKGAFINLANQEHDDGWLIEIAPGGQTEPLHHVFEATYFVVAGRGATTFWQPGKPKMTVEWQAGSLFSPPLNAHYQHFNLEGQKPARLFAGTVAPPAINMFRNPDYVFNDTYIFEDRFSGDEDDFFTDPGKSVATRRWKTNFIPDVRSFKLESWAERGAGGTNMFFSIAGNSMSAHLSEFPPGTYKKAHKHGPGAEIVVLNGIGYSLLWYKGEQFEKVDWKDGSLVSPMDQQYHQHFNSGPGPARYLAFTFGGDASQVTRGGSGGADVSEREGGWQVEYEDQDPAVHSLFGDECKKNGATVTLPAPNYRKD